MKIESPAAAMPRRKLQFSLLTLFVIVTVIAVGLAWLRSLPPAVTRSGVGSWSTPNPFHRHWYESAYAETHQHWTKVMLSEEQHVYYEIVYLPGSLARLTSHSSSAARTYRFYGYPHHSYVYWSLYDEEHMDMGSLEARLEIDVAGNVISLRDQELPLERGGVYIVQWAEDCTPLLSRDDGSFDDLDFDHPQLEEMRAHHRQFVAEMEGRPSP